MAGDKGTGFIPHGELSTLVSLPICLMEAPNMKSDQKVNETSPVQGTEHAVKPFGQNTPPEPLDSDLTGLLNAVASIDGVTAAVKQSVIDSLDIQKKVDVINEKFKKLIDSETDAEIIEAYKGVQAKQIAAATETTRKAVSLAVSGYRAVFMSIDERTLQLSAKYGMATPAPSVAPTEAPTSRKVPTGANITLEIFNGDGIPTERKTAFNMKFNPVEGSKLGFVTGTGHNKGDFFLSNLKNWK